MPPQLSERNSEQKMEQKTLSLAKNGGRKRILELTEKLVALWSKIGNFGDRRAALLGSAFLCLNVFLLFLVSSRPSLKPNSVSTDYLVVALLSNYLLLAYLYLRKLKLPQAAKNSRLLQTMLLAVFSYLYYFRVNNLSFDLYNLDLNTGLVGILLLVLIFLVNLRLLKGEVLSFSLILPQIGLFVLQAFSLISFLKTDRTSSRLFTQNWLEFFFNLPLFSYLVLAAIAVSVVTIANLNYNYQKRRQIWSIGLLLTFLSFQVLVFLHFSPLLTYWYQALIFLIFWDFLFKPLYSWFDGEEKPANWSLQIWISGLYHLILSGIVLLLAYINF